MSGGFHYITPLEPEFERAMIAQRPAVGRAGVMVPTEIFEAKRLFDAGKISRAEVDRRIAAVNAEIRTRAIPQEKRAAPDPARAAALRGARERVRKFHAIER